MKKIRRIRPTVYPAILSATVTQEHFEKLNELGDRLGRSRADLIREAIEVLFALYGCGGKKVA